MRDKDCIKSRKYAYSVKCQGSSDMKICLSSFPGQFSLYLIKLLLLRNESER